MSEKFLSDMWYRVAQLCPRLHPQARIFRQRFRGRAWYVLQDRSSGRVHRLTPATYALINGMDGRQTVDALWQKLAASLGDHAPTQDEVIQLLYQLHAADVLQVDSMPDLGEAIERKRRERRQKWLQSFGNPMALRIRLWDPQRFLDRSWPYVRWLFGPVGLVLWLVVVAAALLQVAQNWSVLSENLADRVLALENLVLLGLAWPVIKFCHEMAHAWALKRGGGEVHEMGLMFLVFMPVPYVDATAAAAFRSKWQRIGVSAAGILAEVFLAALAMFVWLAAEPGAVRAVAFNVMLVGGVSTILFNANPLLRFDGYYMLADLIEIPNLAQRSNRHLGWLVKRYGFGAVDAVPPSQQPGERRWLTLYAPLAWCYRVVIMFSIALFVAAEYFFIGVILALWSVMMMFGWPLAKGIRFVLHNAELDRHRRRAVLGTFGCAALLLILACFVPVPSWTSAEGVVWVPRQAEVRAGGSGFVTGLRTEPGAMVQAGQPLVDLRDDELLTELAIARARVERLGVQFALERFSDRLSSELTRQALAVEEAKLARVERRVAELTARAGREGEWVLPGARDLEGRFVSQGQLLGYVVTGSLNDIRVVVAQEDVDRVRHATRHIGVRLVDRPGETLSARLVREVPEASDEVPSKALTLDGGGRLAADPRDPNGLKTLARTFQFELELAPGAEALRFGTRAHVRFQHHPQPLAVQLWRRLRQVLLGTLGL
jgi:putative peptide zinc metalloprotease protein